MRVVLLAVACLLPLAAFAEDVPVDVLFDKTGDGIVDASDWALMDAQERSSYARASVEALGENPDVQLPGGKSRADIYLEGLMVVYE
jgi:hypothetical protein